MRLDTTLPTQVPCTCAQPGHNGKVYRTIMGYVDGEPTWPRFRIYFIGHDCPRHGMYDEAEDAAGILSRCTDSYTAARTHWFSQSRENMKGFLPHRLPHWDRGAYLGNWSDPRLDPRSDEHAPVG